MSAANMVPLVEWPYSFDISKTYAQMRRVLRSCFDRNFHLLPQCEARAFACFKALTHLYFEDHIRPTSNATPTRRLDTLPWLVSHIPVLSSYSDQSVLMVFALMGIHRKNHVFDWECLSSSDITWLSHMLLYAIAFHQENGSDIPEICFQVISECLTNPQSLDSALADCFLGILLMFRPVFDKNCFVKVDKSSLYNGLRKEALHEIRTALNFGGPQDISYSEDQSVVLSAQALKLLRPISVYFETLPLSKHSRLEAVRLIDWSVRVCMYVLRNNGNFIHHSDSTLHVTLNKTKEESYGYARAALRISLSSVMHWTRESDYNTIWRLPSVVEEYRTPQYFEPLIPYLIDLSQGKDYIALSDALLVMSSMDSSMLDPTDKHQYMNIIIDSMQEQMPARVRHAALKAAWVIRDDIILLESEQDMDHFASALRHAVQVHGGPAHHAQPAEFNPDGQLYEARDLCYLRLLSTLVQDSRWHKYLRDHLHYQNCLKICTRVQQLNGVLTGLTSNRYTLYLAHIIITLWSDGVGDKAENPYDVEIWPLLRQAWKALATDVPYWLEQPAQEYTDGHLALFSLYSYTTYTLHGIQGEIPTDLFEFRIHVGLILAEIMKSSNELIVVEKLKKIIEIIDDKLLDV
ncbi:hypothetical protein M422DRAFT_786094 [Sphaerobolus stellatus SS14]|uniref:Uncharacterized protein n=1 Tax=Sphaerobolus stellatus (strain SS14) TaxID=990650 RepID=A0A0C9TP33_SPHS4|nr:hypothetical protein M422DRAFT_786094 [Sphaerobolus stellatus SS14]